jgi:hypothetical protein
VLFSRRLCGAIHDGWDVEAELAIQRRPHLLPETRLRDKLRPACDLDGADACEIDRANLVAEDRSVLRLAGMSRGNGDLSRIPGLARGDRTDRGHAGCVERLVGDHERTPLALLLMTHGSGLEVHDNHSPPEGSHSAGHPAGPSKSVAQHHQTGTDVLARTYPPKGFLALAVHTAAAEDPAGGACRVDRELLAKWPRILMVVVAGLGAVAGMAVTGIPGNGLFLVSAGLAGLVAGLVAPGWIGYSFLVGTLAVATVVNAYASGWYTGLLALIVVSLIVPATAGWAFGYALVRAHRLGIRAAVQDPRVVGALAGVVAILALIWYATVEFATNPP